MALPDIIFRATHKNVRGKAGTAPYIFEFSDRFSVFDWGDMPDDLHGKAVATTFINWFFFDLLGRPESWQDAAPFGALAGHPLREKLALNGLAHHMIGLAGGDLKPLSLDREILSPSKHMLTRAINPFGMESKVAGDAEMLPFDVRFLFVDDAPQPSIQYLSCSDKSRLTADAAAKLGKLSTDDMATLETLAALTALRLRSVLKGVGVRLAAGKLSFAYGETPMGRQFILADSIGPDELDLQIDGLRLSQDFLCNSYRATSWLSAVEKAKALAAEREEADWKRICTEELKAHPPLLSPITKEKAVMIYKGLARALCEKNHGKTIFADAWDMPRLTAALMPRQKAVA